jgi:hypothetical protein
MAIADICTRIKDMEVLTSPSSCIALAKVALEMHPHVEDLLELSDFQNWEKMLNRKKIPDYVFGNTPFNLLTICVVGGFGLRENLLDPGTAQALRLLTKLNEYLVRFPNLKTDSSFKEKIRNLEKYNFLGTMSELSLAYFYADLDYTITFEQPFRQLSQSRKKNVDVTISNQYGEKIHFEVYTPVDQDGIDGFFSPTDGNHHYEYKIAKKALDKFGDVGIMGLSGHVFLAVNTAIMALITIEKQVDQQSLNRAYKRILSELPPGLNGLLLFHDDFNTANSLYLEGLYLRN